MARILKPASSFAEGDWNGYGASIDVNNASDMRKRNSLFAPSDTDPRLTGEQRLDQRYGNYTYGSYDKYAQDRAWDLQHKGTAAQGTLAAYGTDANTRGTEIYGRTTPATDFSAADATLGKQGDLYGTLEAYAGQGPGPSRAQADLKANTAAATRAQLMLAGSGRGAGGAASGFRQAGMNQAQIQGAANAEAATLGAQEEDAWRQRQLQAYGLGGDVLSSQAAQQSQNAQFKTQAELEAQAQRDSASLAYSQLGLDATTQGYATDLAYDEAARKEFENEAAASQGYEQNLTNLAIGKMDLQSDREQRDAEAGGIMDTILPIAGAVGTMALMSDERNKTNVKRSNLDAYANADDYTDAGWGEDGERRGAATRQQDETFERLKEEREERKKEKETADSAKKADMFSSLLSSYSGAFSSDARSKEKIRELKTENKALVDTLAAYDDGGGPPRVDFAFGDNEDEFSGEELDALDKPKPKPKRKAKKKDVSVEFGPAEQIYRESDEADFESRVADAYGEGPKPYTEGDAADFKRRMSETVGDGDRDNYTAYDDAAFQKRISEAYTDEPDLRPAKAYTYDYKNPRAPGAKPGRQVGPMAQDLEHLPGVVEDTPYGKMVDSPRLAAVTAAAVGKQQKRLDRIEAQLGAYGY